MFNTRTVETSQKILSFIEMLGLLIIVIATIVAGAHEIMRMIEQGTVKLADLLLMFIYLEVLTMVAVYLQSGTLPIRMPLYIAIVALARHLILDMKEISEWEIIATATAMLIISFAVLVIRFGHIRFPYDTPSRESGSDH